MGILALLSLPWVRGWFYEIFIRTYQILTGLYVYGIWQHLPKDHHLPRLCLYIALGIFGLTSSLQFMTILYRNVLFAGCGCPRAIVCLSQ